MIACVFATPGVFGVWGFEILEHIYAEIFGDFLHIHAATIDELKDAWVDRNGRRYW